MHDVGTPVEVELLHVRLELVRPFVTRFGARSHKDAVLVRVRSNAGIEGWGECAAGLAPTYTAEYVDGAWAVLRDHLVPRAFAGVPLDEVAGHNMAKAALRMALLDLELRSAQRPLVNHLGARRDRVPVGVVVERYDTAEEAADVAEAHVAEGYRRIKLKIVPGADVEHAAAVRRRIGQSIALWADANGAYSLSDIDLLTALDVDLLEQPLRAGDLLDHAALRRRTSTTICLDESVATVDDARLALHLGASDVLSVKPGRVGGIEAAVTINDLCRDAGVDLWCGGMLETGIGRAANLALSALAGFTLPGDVSATNRYFATDVITEPFVLGDDGMIAVPSEPGLGVTIDPDVLSRVTVRRELLRPS